MALFELNYKPTPTWARVHNDSNRYIFVRGPVGSGKTSGLVWDSFFNAMQQVPDRYRVRRAKYAILRSSYPALKSTTVKTFQDWFQHLFQVVYDTPIRATITVPHPDGETTIKIEYVFVALDRPEEVNKLQSLELTGAYLNEAAEMPQEVHQMLKSRIDRYPPKRDTGGAVNPRIVCEYNSPDTDHWLYHLAEEIQPPKHSFYVQPPALLLVNEKTDIKDADGNYYKINPKAENIENLSKDYYPDMVAGASASWVRVFILNEYGTVRTGRPVYTEYIDTVHCAEKEFDPNPALPLIIGIDLGLTPAAAFTQLQLGGRLIVFDEIVTENCSIDAFCADYLKPILINRYHNMNYILVLDPAAVVRSQNDAKSAAEIVEKHFPGAVTVGKTNNRLARKEAVVYWLRKQNGFLLSPRCKYLRKGFISHFHYERIRTLSSLSERYRENWDKNIYSHVHEALQYAAMEAMEGLSLKYITKERSRSYTEGTIADAIAGY